MASPQGSSSKRPCQLSRTVIRALRTLATSEEIQCTKSLIDAYNAHDVEDTKGIALHQWLEAYISEFSKRKAESMPESLIREYALLASITAKSSASADMVRRVYVGLRSCVKTGEYCSPIIVVALDDMLRVMDAKIVEKEAQSLVSLADDLLGLTNPEKCIFTRETYAFNTACLLTLERTLTVLHRIECTHSKQRVVEFFRDRLKTQLKAIAAEQNYYPIVYSTQLIRYNIDSLIKGGPTATLLNAGRRAFYAICGGLYLFQGIRELAVMQIDFAAIEAGVRKMQQAFSGLLDSEAPGLQELVHAASESERTQDFSHITEWYKKHERPFFIDGILPKQRKIVKFALVSHLTLFASESSGSDLSDKAFCLLSSLAVNDDTSQWRADSDIYECLLDALASVGARRHLLRQDCLQLLQQMEISSIQNQQTVKDWRGTCSIEQKLDKNCCREPEILSTSLYHVVRSQLGMHMTSASSLAHKQQLIEYYQDDNFAKVSLLLDDGEKRHIADFDFHLVVYELVDVTNQVTNKTSSADDEQMTHNMERSRWVQTPVKLRQIFAKRRRKPNGPEEEVNRILLFGNPRTGKTSLSKRLCNGWASKYWGSEFEQVYLLPIRQLTNDRLKSEKTLEEAIALLLFNAGRKSADEWNALHHQIKDELAEKTTLLVLDGLDETSDNSIAEEIVSDALSRSCSILVLSRPHNLGAVRSKMDVQIECLGLSDDQLKAYVRREASDTSEELIQFLKKSALVWETAKAPINAQILCTLWKSEEGQRMKEFKCVSLKAIYSSMMEYAWQRFEDKTPENVDRQSMFSSLETIAFKAISQGKVEIPRDLVMKHSQGTTTRRLLLDSGFLLFREEGQVFEFAHLSFQEFFAGRFLAKNLRGTAKECKKAKQYIAERKYYDTSRVTLSFMTQCYCQEEEDDDEEECIKSLKELLSILDEASVEVVGFRHTLLKMRTLDAFLSVCGGCANDIRSDYDLQKIPQTFITTLRAILEALNEDEIYIPLQFRIDVYFGEMLEDLDRMPNLFARLPDFLSILLRDWAEKYGLGPDDLLGIAKLVRFSPEQLLRMVQVKLGGDNAGHDYGNRIHLSTLFELFAKSGPECALLALEHLKTACQDQRWWIRKEAYRAVVCFLQVFPENEEIHSLCMDAMKDTDPIVRKEFLGELSRLTFEPDSMAANLAFTLTVEATRDDDDDVRRIALKAVVRSDQTSAASIEKMIELLLEYIPTLTYGDWHSGFGVLSSIDNVLRKCPAKLTVFLPFLAFCYNNPKLGLHRQAAIMSRDLSVFLPKPQARELGEMISRIFWEVEDPGVRKKLATVLYDIGRKIPEFMDDLRHVFSNDCSNTDSEISKLAEDRETIIMITSAESVEAINEVFWDQSVGVKKELLLQMERENMVNAETAETVLEMVANCMDSYNDADSKEMFSLLSSVARFRSLSQEAFSRWLKRALKYGGPRVCDPVFAQPLDIQLRYYWETADIRLQRYVAMLFATGSVTYKAGRDGRSIVSIIRKGKKTELEAPTALVKDVIGLARSFCADAFNEVPSSSSV